MAVIILLEGMWEWICGGVQIVTLSEGMWEWICGGVHIYQSCRPSIALVHLVYFQLFSKTAKNKSVGVKMTKNICKEGLKHLELSKWTVQTTALVNITS